MSKPLTIDKRYDCQECGMNVSPTEYHPYLYCQLYKAGLLDDVKAQIEAMIAERDKYVIGDDETHWIDHFGIEHNVPTDGMNARNNLRAEARQRATKYNLTLKEGK